MNSDKITIFIAGSIHSPWVKDVKKSLKSLQYEIRDELKLRYSMELRCTDCDNPAADNNQEKYNAQIKQDTDIFVLLVDRSPVGPYSLEELFRASVYTEEQKHPQAYVFLKEELRSDSYAKELVSCVKSLTGRYSVYADKPEDVKRKMADIIWNVAKEKKNQTESLRRQEEAEKKRQEQAETLVQQQSRRQRFVHWMLGLLTLLVIGGASIGSYLWTLYRHSAPILFVGGGTVRSYLDSCRVNIANRDDGIYIHLPTGDTWVMLGEEQKVDETTRNGERKYYPVIFAADDIRDNMSALKIDNEKEYLDKVGHIVDMPIGEDALFVTIPGEAQKLDVLRPFLHHLDDNAITASELADILVHFYGSDSLQVYHTTPSSGTVATYRKAMTTASDRVDEDTPWCWMRADDTGHSEYNSKNTRLSDIARTPFLILESEHYHVRGSFGNSSTRQLKFVDAGGRQYKKSLHLYFVLRRKSADRDDFVIDPPLRSFLTEVAEHIPMNYDVKKEYIGFSSPQIVVQFNELSAGKL